MKPLNKVLKIRIMNKVIRMNLKLQYMITKSKALKLKRQNLNNITRTF